MSIDRVMPNNPDAERAVLGAMLLADENKIAIPVVLQILKDSSYFYNSKNGLIFDAIVGLYQEGTPVDLITVTGQLEQNNALERIGGVPELDEIIQSCPTASNAEYYAKQVADEHVRRVVIRAGSSMQALAFDPTADVDDVVNRAENFVFGLRGERLHRGIASAKQIVKETVDYLRDPANLDGGIIGLTTGFHELDMMISGFHGSEFIVVGGRPGMGKSTFVQNIVQYIAEHAGVSVLIFSLEMSAMQIAMRMLSSETGIDFHKVRTGRMSDDEYGSLTMGQAKISQLPIFIDDTPGISMTELRSKVHQMSITNNIGLVVVDYLQLMPGDRRSENKEQEVAGLSLGFKNLAREFDIPVIVCAQLNRANEQRVNKRPILSDLRNSGAIEQDADLVLFLHRPKEYDSTEPVDIGEVIIAKQRNGPTGTVKLLFQGQFLRFKELR